MAAGPQKGCWKSAAELKEIYAARGITPDKDIYIYGHTDLSASYTLVSLYLAGYPLEKLHVYGGRLDRLEPQQGAGGDGAGQVDTVASSQLSVKTISSGSPPTLRPRS